MFFEPHANYRPDRAFEPHTKQADWTPLFGLTYKCRCNFHGNFFFEKIIRSGNVAIQELVFMHPTKSVVVNTFG